MPRVHRVQRARKANKEHGIKVGDSYYWWKFRHGGKCFSKTPPRPSQLTQSKASNALAAAEEAEDIIRDSADAEDMRAALTTAAEAIREVAQEYRDSRDNMPESLQDGPTGQDCEEKADALETWADDIESAVDNCASSPNDYWEPENHDNKPAPDDVEFDALTADEQAAYLEDLRDEMLSCLNDCPI